jgi:hypothetical protein
MAELGQTSDPRELVPGDPDAVTRTVWALQAYGDVLIEAGQGLATIDTEDGWQGEAADAFRERFHGEPRRWIEAGDCFHDAASALNTYISTLTWAQGKAGEAITLWNDGQALTANAKADYDRAAQDGQSATPFTDPGEAKRQDARECLTSARTQLADAGRTAATKVKAATGKAPEKPGFWSEVGDFFGDLGRGIENVGVDLVNGLASVGNAMVEHPGDVASAAGGLVLAGLSAGGEGLGVVLDATGVGAVPGVALNVASAAGITTGVGLAAAGLGDLVNHAANDSKVEPLQSSSESSTSGGSAQPSASDLIKNGQEYKGSGGRGGNNLPSQGGPRNGTLYKTDPQTGEVTNYTTYDADGRAIKRVDLVGRSHGGVETPHVVEYVHNTNPKTGQVFIREGKEVRAAFPWEVP